MKNLYRIIVLTLLLPLATRAQQAPTSFTLDEAIAYALENSVTAKNATIDEQIATAKVNETRGLGLPQIDGTVQVVHNPKLGRFFAAYNPNAGFSLIQDPPNGVNPGDVLSQEQFFQLKSSGDASLTITQLIFNSSYLVGLKAATAYRELSKKQTQQSKEQIIENVSKAYYGAIINQERIKLFDANIARVDSLFRSTKAFNANGFVEEIDVDRTEVTLNNLLAERNKFVNIQILSLELLKYQMNYPLETDIVLNGTIADVNVDRDISSLSNNWDYKLRTDYSILESQRALQGLDVKNKYSSSLPSLVGFANVGYNTQSSNVGGIFKTETNFEDNNLNNPAGYGYDKWYSYSRIGLTLNIPIFSGLQRNYQLQQSKLTALKIENGFTTLKQGIDLEIKQSKITYENALTSLDAQSRNTKLAEKIARVTKIKYEQGVGSSLEVTEAESSLREAQINYYNALYDAVVSRIDLIKAYGKINTLTTVQK
jgi:outer membrane protein